MVVVVILDVLCTVTIGMVHMLAANGNTASALNVKIVVISMLSLADFSSSSCRIDRLGRECSSDGLASGGENIPFLSMFLRSSKWVTLQCAVAVPSYCVATDTGTCRVEGGAAFVDPTSCVAVSLVRS